MKKFTRLLALAVCASIGLTGCDSEKSNPEGPKGKTIELSVDSQAAAGLNFNARQNDIVTVTVTTNAQSWEPSVQDPENTEWITVDKISSTQFTVEIGDYDGSDGDTRGAKILIRASDPDAAANRTISVDIKQNRPTGSSISLDVTEHDFNMNGENITVTATTNASQINYEQPAGTESWLTVTVTGKTVKIDAGANNTPKPRNVEVKIFTVEQESEAAVVKVTQGMPITYATLLGDWNLDYSDYSKNPQSTSVNFAESVNGSEYHVTGLKYDFFMEYDDKVCTIRNRSRTGQTYELTGVSYEVLCMLCDGAATKYSNMSEVPLYGTVYYEKGEVKLNLDSNLKMSDTSEFEFNGIHFRYLSEGTTTVRIEEWYYCFNKFTLK